MNNKNKIQEILTDFCNSKIDFCQTVDALDNLNNSDKIENQITYQGPINNNIIPFDETTKPIVEVKGLTKKYGNRDVPTLNNVSFNIYPGQFHAFIGANGSGKTTTIKCIIGAYSSSKMKGEILINGSKNTSIQAKQLIGYIPENAIFPSNLSARDYLYVMTTMSGYNSKDAKKIVDDLLDKLNLKNLSSKNPNGFSSGQKKKLLLAQALVHNPSILIMDEPAANLDPTSRIELFDTLLALQSEGKSIFISSHILDELSKYATYVTIIDGGNIPFSSNITPEIDLTSLYKQYVKVGSLDSDKK